MRLMWGTSRRTKTPAYFFEGGSVGAWNIQIARYWGLSVGVYFFGIARIHRERESIY